MSKINQQINFYATLYMDMQKPVKLNDLHLIKKTFVWCKHRPLYSISSSFCANDKALKIAMEMNHKAQKQMATLPKFREVKSKIPL